MKMLRSFGLVTAALLVWAAAANAQPVIAAGSLSSGEASVPYSDQLSASDSDGTATCCTWAVTSGSLPPGLSLNSANGTISGTPTVAGGFPFQVTATDSNSAASDPASFAISISSAPGISPASLPAGEQGVPYTPTLTASGGSGGFDWQQTGALPAGVSFSNGAFSGTPGAGSAGSYPISVTVTDSNGGTSGPRSYTIVINPPPSINPATLPQGQVGVPYPTTTLTAVGGTPPYTWSTNPATVPAGLSFSNGVFSGTPTTTVTNASITAQVTDALGGTATLPLSLTVISAPTITTTSLPASDVSAIYNQTLNATGGTPPYTWSVSVGTLPTEINLNSSSGLLSGTITGSTSTFTIKVTDNAGGTDTHAYTLTVNPALSITTASLPQGDAGKAYSQTLTLTGGTPPTFTWSVASGLPTGITVSSAGVLSGTTSSTGAFPFTAQVTDGILTTTKPLTLTINPALTITTAALAAGDAGAPYSQTLAATGGATPYTWAIPAATLPTGISLNASTGVISGTTSSSGSFSITATLTDNISATTSHPYTLVINPPLTITTPPTLSSGSVNSPYSQTLGASGGASPYTWSVTAGSLGSGSLTLNGTTGVISGTPTSSGTLHFTAQVTDAISKSTTKDFTITVTAGLTISTAPALPGGVVGSPYSQPLVAVGGTPGYTWVITVGSLPNPLTLNTSTGVISGTPTSSGSSSFTVQVTDTASGSAVKSFTLVIAAPLTITTAPGLPSSTANTPYSQTLAATGGTPPYTWSVSAGLLPAGLSLNGATGVLGGTPTSSGNFSFTVQVKDSASLSVSKPFTLAIASGLSISTAPTLPSGAVGSPYSQTLVAVGGTSPYTWTITLGSLPAGLGLNPTTGLISGTPTVGGNFGFTVKVTDSTSVSASKAFAMNISAGLTIVTAPTLPSGSTGVAYSALLVVTGGTSPYHWSITAGALPAGITLDPATGNLAGTTSASGTFSFTAQVTDNASISATKPFTFTIAAGLTIGTAPGLPSATLGTPYFITLAAVGGTAPFAWSITGGSLPGGMSLNSSTGVIGGSPNTAGDFNFTVRVTDGAAGSATKGFTLTVVGGLTITTAPSLPDGTISASYSQALVATGGTAPYTWSITAGSLPLGLTLNPASGFITGTPSTVGTSTFTVKATDRAGVSVTKPLFTIRITSDLTITTPLPLLDGVVGTAYSVTLAAAGGKPPYGWSIKASPLPAGLTLSSSTGTISGTPTTAKDFPFTVQVADNLGATFTKDFSIHVALSALPNLTVGGLPSTMDASDQSAIILTLDAPYSADIHGQITLAFQPDATVNVDDPAVQFSTGGRTATFTIAANSLQPTAHIALQTGTVSGTITVTISLEPSGATQTHTVHIARAVPSIRDNGVSVVATTGGFEIHIIGWSTPRNLTDAKVHLTPAAGHNLQTTDLTVSLASVAQQWYASAASAQFGSQFTLVLPFTVQGTTSAIAAVSVQLDNSVGASALGSANF